MDDLSLSISDFASTENSVALRKSKQYGGDVTSTEVQIIIESRNDFNRQSKPSRGGHDSYDETSDVQNEVVGKSLKQLAMAGGQETSDVPTEVLNKSLKQLASEVSGSVSQRGGYKVDFDFTLSETPYSY
jgi:N-acyl-D-aspartate/D-glutamate deacylase